MLNSIAKNIIIKALRIREERGEAPEKVLETYHNLTDSENIKRLARLFSSQPFKISHCQRFTFNIQRIP